MKILIVSPTPTHPPDAGNRVRILALASTLKVLGHDVHIAYIETESADLDAMELWWGKKLHRISYTRPAVNPGVLERQLKRLSEYLDPTRRFCLRVDDWFDDGALDVLRVLDAEHQFDAVIVEYVFMSKSFEAFSLRALKIIDTHDIFTDRHKIYLANGQHPQWFSTSRKEEAKALSRADAVIAIQEKEQDFFRELTRVQVSTVGHLVRVEPLWQPPPRARVKRTLLFVGSGNPINVRCVEDFLESTYPLLSQAVPDIELLVAGTVCEQLSEQPGMVKLGALPDISDAYKHADIVVNPVRYGTGLNVKTVEALGFGMPIVSTSTGAKGLGIEPLPLAVADDPRQFASEVMRLLADPNSAALLAAKASVFAREWNIRHTAALEKLLAR